MPLRMSLNLSIGTLASIRLKSWNTSVNDHQSSELHHKISLLTSVLEDHIEQGQDEQGVGALLIMKMMLQVLLGLVALCCLLRQQAHVDVGRVCAKARDGRSNQADAIPFEHGLLKKPKWNSSSCYYEEQPS